MAVFLLRWRCTMIVPALRSPSFESSATASPRRRSRRGHVGDAALDLLEQLALLLVGVVARLTWILGAVEGLTRFDLKTVDN